MRKINGTVSASQSLTGSMEFYRVFAKSEGAYTDPEPNPSEEDEIGRGVNILVTNSLSDQSQKNFEILFLTIGLRAVPVSFGNPRAVERLEEYGSPTLTGEGFIWNFTCEREDIFKDFATNDDVGLLKTDVDGVFIDSGVRLTTNGAYGIKNIEFAKVGIDED